MVQASDDEEVANPCVCECFLNHFAATQRGDALRDCKYEGAMIRQDQHRVRIECDTVRPRDSICRGLDPSCWGHPAIFPGISDPKVCVLGSMGQKEHNMVHSLVCSWPEHACTRCCL